MTSKSEQHDDGQPKMKMTFNTVIRDNGRFVVLPIPLIKFMGITNTVFLIGIIDHYNYLRKRRRVKGGRLFYNATYFKRKWDVSLYQQNKAIKELSNCGLLKETGKTFRNQKSLKINIIGCCCIAQLIYDIAAKVNLPSFFKKILENEILRKLIKKWLKRMRLNWPDDDFPRNGKFTYEKFKNSILKNLRTDHV